jgi:membrane-bound lytic murein transglycosylase D
MTWKPRIIARVIFGVLLAAASSFLYCQQSNLQTSFFSSAAARVSSTGVVADIAETENLSYIRQVIRDNRATAFQPNPSDLLIQQAEQRFRTGKREYQDRDFEHARMEFDAAIDGMLKASDNPTDRRLFEAKLEDMVDTIHRYDLSGMGAAAVETVPEFDKAPLEDIVQMTFPVDPRIKTKVQTELRNTASALPLVVNDVVLGYINYFNGRGRRTIEYGLARAGKYSAMISKVLAEEGVPQELIYLAQAESGFLPRAVSRAAAEGMWQFVKFRGNQYGLMQTPYSDDRFDPEKATRAAARHLHDLYNEFQDWYLAIAAYNCGPGCVERAVERTGYADYWELRARHAIPAETTNYVPIILAMTIMGKNAPEFGLDRIVPDQPVDYDTVHIRSRTNLALIGDLTDTPTSELLQLNPALLRGLAPEDFDLRVPKGAAEQLEAGLDLVPAENRDSWRMHRVEAGEDLAAIARRFNATPKLISSANSLSGAEPAAGDRLLIPAVYHETLVPARTATAAGHRLRQGGGTQVSSRKTPVRTLAARATTSKASTVLAAKRPVHRSAGTVAQVSHRAHIGD